MKKIKILVRMLALVTLLDGCSNNVLSESSQDIVTNTNASQKEIISENENSTLELTEDEMEQINALNRDEKHDWY